MLTSNPAHGVKRLKMGEHKPWPDYVLEYALKEATPMLRLAIVMLLTTGQRISDVCAMTHHNIKDGCLAFTQGKTGTEMDIPLHPRLAEELAKVERKSVYVLYNRRNAPFQPDIIRQRLRRLLSPKGWEGYTPHGLRKNATIELIELGLSENAVASITGHKNMNMIRHYGKQHDRKKLSDIVGETWKQKANVRQIFGEIGKPKVENR